MDLTFQTIPLRPPKEKERKLFKGLQSNPPPTTLYRFKDPSKIPTGFSRLPHSEGVPESGGSLKRQVPLLGATASATLKEGHSNLYKEAKRISDVVQYKLGKFGKESAPIRFFAKRYGRMAGNEIMEYAKPVINKVYGMLGEDKVEPKKKRVYRKPKFKNQIKEQAEKLQENKQMPTGEAKRMRYVGEI